MPDVAPAERDEGQAEERKQPQDGAEDKQEAHVMGGIEKGFSQRSKPGDVPVLGEVHPLRSFAAVADSGHEHSDH